MARLSTEKANVLENNFSSLYCQGSSFNVGNLAAAAAAAAHSSTSPNDILIFYEILFFIFLMRTKFCITSDGTTPFLYKNFALFLLAEPLSIIFNNFFLYWHWIQFCSPEWGDCLILLNMGLPLVDLRALNFWKCSITGQYIIISWIFLLYIFWPKPALSMWLAMSCHARQADRHWYIRNC